ncbi:MAG: TonB-dependent receptor domain-containing protein [Blastocatellia bacterium]
MRHRIWSVITLLMLFAISAFAQFSSAVKGNVQDSNQAVVPNATVKLKSLQSGLTQETKSNDSGFYRFSSLAPGDYELTVENQGFQTRTLRLSLTAGQSRDANVELAVGGASATVDVTSQAPILDTGETRLEITLKQEKIRDLPLLNNSIFSLLALAPGVTGVTAANDNFNPEYFSNFSANGRSASGNTYNVDGLSVTSNITYGTLNLSLNPEAVQEVSIETNTFKAEQGRGSSIVVSYITKSGSNQYHGGANYWFTNQDMRARTSLPFVRTYAPFARQNLSGGFGGPIIKNKTFFFGALEMLRSKNSVTGVETYESSEFVNWARTNFANSIGTKLLTENPINGPVRTNVLRTASDIFGAANCGTAATNNIPCTLPMVVQGTWSRSPFKNGLQYSIRGDHNMRDGKDRIYGSFVRTESDNAVFFNRPNLNTQDDRFVNAFQGNWTHTFNPSLLNEFSASGNKVQGRASNGARFRIPAISIQGSTGVGVGFGGSFVQHNQTIRDVVSWVKGSHSLKFGGEYFWGDDYALFAEANSRPSFSFLNLLDLVKDAPFSGTFGAYDPLTGKPNNYQFGAKLNTFSGFAQDEWKVRPNLTLTMSLRWDDFGNPVALNGDPVRDWKMTNLFVGPGSTVDEIIPNATVRLVDKPFNGRLNKNFSPRFGFAWSPGKSSKWSVRGGIGLYNDWVTLGESVDRVNINPPNFIFPNFGVNLPLKPIFSVGSSDTFPFGFTQPTIAAGALDARGGIVGLQSGIGGLDPNLTTPKTINFIAGVERELARRTVVGINFSSSRTWDSIVGADYNRRPNDLLDGRLDRINPSFGAITYITNFNKSTYKALIASVRTSIGKGGLIQGSYTLSQVTDLYQGGSRSVGFEQAPDPRQFGARPGDALFDARHRVSMSGAYQLPTPFRDNLVSKYVLGGWEIGLTGAAQTGNPFFIFTNAAFNPIRNAAGQVTGLNPNSGDFNADGFNYDIPNQVGNLARKGDRNTLRNGTAQFSLADFPIPTIGTVGNSPRSYFRQQGFINVNASVIKNNALPFLGEAGNLQLKFEFFNALNRVNLGGMNNNLASFQFGRITSQGDPRVVQVGARIAF